MTFDNEKNTDQKPEEPKLQNPRVQRLNLARELARQSDQNPASTPRQNLSLSMDILEALAPAAQSGDLSTLSTLEALEQVVQRASSQLDGVEAKIRRLELKRNQRRN